MKESDLFWLGVILLFGVIFAVYQIGYNDGNEAAGWRYANQLESLNEANKNLINKLVVLESRYESSLEALNISNQYNENQTSLIIGRSYTDKFYFVLTDGYNSSEIASSDQHELCHQLVFRSYQHFCS